MKYKYESIYKITVCCKKSRHIHRWTPGGGLRPCSFAGIREDDCCYFWEKNSVNSLYMSVNAYNNYCSTPLVHEERKNL